METRSADLGGDLGDKDGLRRGLWELGAALPPCAVSVQPTRPRLLGDVGT